MKRLIFDVLYRNSAWYIDLRDFDKGSGRLVPAYTNKKMALQNAVTICNCLWFDAGVSCQLVIHKKNGEIQSERTYPDNTPERKG
jgi:hypothetical protein